VHDRHASIEFTLRECENLRLLVESARRHFRCVRVDGDRADAIDRRDVSHMAPEGGLVD
jgi:hypothetical protein